MSRPLDFIVIGASKSGTTALFQHLKRHPRIHIPASKEVPFFSRDDWFERGWDWFVEEFFRHAPEDRLWGTVTPQYLEDAPRASERIHQEMPEVRLVAILRNPVDRAFSAYRMRVRKGREKRSFEEAVSAQLEPDALERARVLPWSSKTVTERYLVTSEYGRLLGEFYGRFSTDRMLVVFTEQLVDDPQGLLNRVLTFLGLEPSFSPPDLGRRYYAGGAGERFPGLAAMASRVAPLRWLWRALPAERRRAIRWWYLTEGNVRRGGETDGISDEVHARLVHFFGPDVRDLVARIGAVPWEEFRTARRFEVSGGAEGACAADA